MLTTSSELISAVAARVREARLAADLTQAGLAARAGVSLGSIRRFETTGQIALESLARLAIALRRERDFEALFVPPPIASLDALISPAPTRRRGRRT
jgi:transcriptional regulator with XRE-family HTH domain